MDTASIVFILLAIIVTCSCCIPCCMYIAFIHNRQEIQIHAHPDIPIRIRVIEEARVDEPKVDEPKVDDPCQV